MKGMDFFLSDEIISTHFIIHILLKFIQIINSNNVYKYTNNAAHMTSTIQQTPKTLALMLAFTKHLTIPYLRKNET